MIAYIDSPFQLLQCYEIHKSGINIETIYVRLNGQAENDGQLMSLIALLNLKQSKVVNVSKMHHKAYYYSMFLFLTFFKSKLIIGDPNSFLFKILSKIFSANKFLLLDDGVATVSNFDVNKDYQRFTIFPDCVSYPLVNEFSHVRNFVRVEDANVMHVIVGSKFIDAGICSESSYDRALSRVIEELDVNFQCIYIAHRGESEIQLDRLKRKFCFKIIRTIYPIELLTFETKIYPKSITHLLSTAVFSMRKIYDDVPIYTFRMCSSEILKRKDAIELLYDKIELDGFSIFIS